MVLPFLFNQPDETESLWQSRRSLNCPINYPHPPPFQSWAIKVHYLFHNKSQLSLVEATCRKHYFLASSHFVSYPLQEWHKVSKRPIKTVDTSVLHECITSTAKLNLQTPRVLCINRRSATLQRTLFIYLLNKYISLSGVCLTMHH